MVGPIDFQTGLEAHARGDLGRARRLYLKVLKQEPNHPAALGWLATIEMQEGNHWKAKGIFERALTLGGLSEDLQPNYATLLQVLGQYARAVDE
jgi:Tfp pilus assembly protein PilF